MVMMLDYVSIPVIRRWNGVTVEATRNGAWVMWPSEQQLFIAERQLWDHYARTYRSGGRITPVSTGLFIEMPEHPPVYLTHCETQRIVSVIRQLQAEK